MNKKAYLDPGTGGVVISSLWTLGVVIFTTILAFITKVFWKPIKKKIKKLFKRK